MPHSGPISLIVDQVAIARYVRLDLGIWIISQSLLIYDYICTFKSEVEYVWSCPWSIGLILFYLNRYLPIVSFVIVMYVKCTPMQVKSCGSLAPAVLWITTGGLLASSAIIALRTYAIWGRRRLIFIILIGWTIVFPGTMVMLGGIMTHDILKLSAGSNSTVKITCPTNVPTTFVGIFVFYIMVFVGEFVIVILTGIKAKQHMQRSSPSWVHELYQNGILQCVSLMALSLLNSVIMFEGATQIKMSILPAICILFSVTVSSFSSLNIDARVWWRFLTRASTIISNRAPCIFLRLYAWTLWIISHKMKRSGGKQEPRGRGSGDVVDKSTSQAFRRQLTVKDEFCGASLPTLGHVIAIPASDEPFVET